MVGASGRIVVEVDTDLKQQLYAALQNEGITLKEWFLHNARSYLSTCVQPSLFESTHSEVNQ